MSELTVGAGLVRGLIDMAVAQGAGEQALAQRSGIHAGDIEDHDARVPMSRYIALMHAAQDLTGDPAFALHFGAHYDLADLSIAGLIMNASETMGEAFLQMNRFGRLVIEVEGVGMGAERFQRVVVDGQYWLVDARENPNAFPELTEVTFARIARHPRRFLEKPHVIEVHVTHPAPAYAAEYERVFEAPVVFASHWNAMRMDPNLSSYRVALQPRYVFGALAQYAEALLQELENSKSVRGRVESLLMPKLHTGDISINAIAEKLGVSRQTLFRRLKAEGVTFEKVLDDLRHRLALDYLGGRRASVNETAYLVGFSDPAAFSRAFKRWTGKSPREMRKASPD